MTASPGTPLLDARSVGETAEKAVLSLPLPKGDAFKALYSYLATDEPAVHLMPLHFLPRSSRGTVENDALHLLGVAAKLEYVRSRWIDEVVDLKPMEPPSTVHRLHDALVGLISSRYSKALQGRDTTTFFRTLTELYARHALSVAVDGSRSRTGVKPLGGEDYSAQVYARNGSFRAAVDAVMLFSGASDELLQKARQCWHSWVLGAQLYDDALDAEEDFESGHVTWTVARTLSGFDGRGTKDFRPDRDEFYEAALVGGALTETLAWAESCFESAARLAEVEFPSWATLQRACNAQTSQLRNDLQKLTDEAAWG